MGRRGVLNDFGPVEPIQTRHWIHHDFTSAIGCVKSGRAYSFSKARSTNINETLTIVKWNYETNTAKLLRVRLLDLFEPHGAHLEPTKVIEVK